MTLFGATLFALSSAHGRAGVAVVRVSGPRAGDVLARMCRPEGAPAPRRAAMRVVVDPASGETIDQALVLWFPAPRSFTGEDVVELHLHGSRAVVGAVLEILARLEGFAPAPAGAFARRAFDNGKMDLTEAEGLADLIDAQTAAQRRQALRQMDGALGRLYRGWAETLSCALAYNEAAIDFADEEDVPALIAQKQDKGLAETLAAIKSHLADDRRGERLREGLVIALLGAPNAGKSSLLNALARREAAIVSPVAGTTRDVIEVDLDLGGYPVCLLDTAGLRESGDPIESEGVRRALARAAQADLKLLLFDGAAAQPFDDATLSLADKDALIVVNKKDVATGLGQEQKDALFVSAKTGDGLAELTVRLKEEIACRFAPMEAPALTRARHRQALEDCGRHLAAALAARAAGAAPELVAEDVRLAVRALGRITGRVDADALLERIFSSFCVGK